MDTVEQMRERLKRGLGISLKTWFRDNDTQVVLIPNTSYLERPEKLELLIAFEGRGCFFWDGVTQLNKFLLTAAGIPLSYAGPLVDLILDIMAMPPVPEILQLGLSKISSKNKPKKKPKKKKKRPIGRNKNKPKSSKTKTNKQPKTEETTNERPTEPQPSGNDPDTRPAPSSKRRSTAKRNRSAQPQRPNGVETGG